MPARALLVVLLLALCTACGNSTGDTTTGEAAQITTPTTGGTTVSSKDCEQVDKPAPKKDGGQKPPDGQLGPNEQPKLVFDTNCGSFTVTLDPKSAPKTGASLVKLARNGFFDDTIFHRIVPGFVIQGGDPTGTGTGGPGYKTVDKPPAGSKYTHGVVAMAKTGAEAPGTSGSQFFVVTGDDVGLPPDYAIVGEVTDGLDVVDKIGALGDASEQPTQTIVIKKVTVKE
jgi:cyclophilin family peptidyl-prolyl cis-trans isomerase